MSQVAQEAEEAVNNEPTTVPPGTPPAPAEMPRLTPMQQNMMPQSQPAPAPPMPEPPPPLPSPDPEGNP
jgi:hypothetical protein